MLNNEWRRWQGKGKCSLTMKDMKPGTRESIFTTEEHGGKNLSQRTYAARPHKIH